MARSVILVGTDGSERATDAIALGADLADALGADLELAAVLDYNPLPIDIEPYEEALREHFDEIFDQARGRLGDRPAAEHRLTGSGAARELSELAERLGAELIVVGSTHRGRIGRVHPGSVGSELLSGAGCPVATAPAGLADRDPLGIRTIGVGYDAGPESERAFALAHELVREGGTIRLIGVVPYRLPISEELANPFECRAVFTERLGGALGEAVGAYPPVAVEQVMEEGDPAERLLAQSSRLDLLVLGARGWGPVRSVLLGSVSAQVIAGAECPVIVTPRGARLRFEPTPSEPGADLDSG